VNRGPADRQDRERAQRPSVSGKALSQAPGAWIETQIGMPGSQLLSPPSPSQCRQRNLESASGAYLMQSMLRVMFAALVAVAVAHLPTAAMAQPAVKQIKLTEKQIQGFIAAQKEMQPIMEKIQGATSDQLDPKLQAALEAAAKKNGFKDMADYDEVAANISMVMAGIDPQTKVFTEPQVAIKKRSPRSLPTRASPSRKRSKCWKS